MASPRVRRSTGSLPAMIVGLAACMVIGYLSTNVQTFAVAVLSRGGAASAVKERPGQEADDATSGNGGKGTDNKKNSTLELFAGLNEMSGGPGVAQGPPWVSCSVEYMEATPQGPNSQDVTPGTMRNVLEEWHLRGDPTNLDAFKNWRLRGNGDATVRCTATAVQNLEDVMCLECVDHSGAAAMAPSANLRSNRGAGVMHQVQASVIMSFTDLQQCYSGTPAGLGFCKSGKVFY